MLLKTEKDLLDCSAVTVEACREPPLLRLQDCDSQKCEPILLALLIADTFACPIQQSPFLFDLLMFGRSYIPHSNDNRKQLAIVDLVNLRH